MFLPRFSMAADGVNVDQKSSTSSTKVKKTNFHSTQSESLLSVLDDKNRIITSLKKQLQNQKMQLGYYITRELNEKKISQLSKSCTPQASEESLPLNLAINNFCRQTGIKTKLLMLHERMARLDCKISHCLRDQEVVLRKIMNKLCEFVKKLSYEEIKDRFGRFLTDPIYIDLFNKLLSATVRLERKLDGFKICCDRVLLVEEERNIIVEQVYSLPPEDRINCNYMLGIQMEKVQLENEIKRHENSRHNVKELSAIENILHNLQSQVNSCFAKNEGISISKMLKKINSQARVLLEMTNEQRQKFECQLSKTNCPEPNRVLLFISLASGADKFEDTDYRKYGINTENEIRFFEMIKQELDLLKQKVRQEAAKDITKVKTECDSLKGKISNVMIDNNRLKFANRSLREELEEARKLKSEQFGRTQSLMQERDAYKAQVEDLQTIREAYAQLVDKQPNTLQMESNFLREIDQRDNRILELESMVAKQKREIDDLNTKVDDQLDQIFVLSRYMNLTRPNSPQCEDPDKSTMRIQSALSLQNFPIYEKNAGNYSKSLDCIFPVDRKSFQNLNNYEKISLVKQKRPKDSVLYALKDFLGKISRSSDNLSEQELCNSTLHSRDAIEVVVTTSRALQDSVQGQKSHFTVKLQYNNSEICCPTSFPLDEMTEGEVSGDEDMF